MKPKSATYLKYIYACFRLRQPDKAYQMLLNMEKEWRVPESKDYTRMCVPTTTITHTHFHGSGARAKHPMFENRGVQPC